MKKLMFTAAAAAALVFTGCKKEEEQQEEQEKETTVAEDKQNIENSLDGIVSCMSTFKSGDFVSSMVDFFEMSQGDALHEEWVGEVFDSLFHEADFEYLEESERFIFANHYGTYSFNHTTKHFDKTNDQTAAAIFKFPSKKSSTTNDAVFTIDGYTDIKIVQDGDEFYIPKTASLVLTKGGTEIAHLKLTNSTWEVGTEVSVPTNITGSLMLAPFTYNLVMERATSTEFTVDIDVESTTACEYHADGTLKLKHSDYANLDGDTDIDNLHINFEYGSLAISFDADIDALAAYEDPTPSQVNEKIEALVNYNSKKIGEIEALEVQTDSVEMHIRYKDNTTQNLKDYADPFFDDMEAVFKDITGEWD